ncbi:MAG: 4Fe-4S dicluster domain-containing protein [Elusimicrobia bacterium]|nr:4Fe-4S dicluster domain-containing protein [Elusimicrobiota bacterium]
MKYPKLRELKEAIKALIKGPFTTKFPFEPHTPFPRFRGIPVPNEKEGCIGCGACADVCPPRAIKVVDDLAANPPMRSIRWRHDYCIFCGQCERLCTTKEGVKLSNTEFDIADLNRNNMFAEIKKELIVCSDCGEVIAPKEQILYIAKKLGPMGYSNINLIVFTQQEFLDTSHIASEKSSQSSGRQSAFKILCPKCRHQVWVFDDHGK